MRRKKTPKEPSNKKKLKKNMESLYCSERLEIWGIRTHSQTKFQHFNLLCQSDNSKKDNRKAPKTIKKSRSSSKLQAENPIFFPNLCRVAQKDVQYLILVHRHINYWTFFGPSKIKMIFKFFNKKYFQSHRVSNF
jgi:hypothetical protein